MQMRLNGSNAFFDEKMNRVSVANVQQVSDRAFYVKGGRWVDSRVAADKAQAKPSVLITFGSKAHLDLARRLAKDGRQGCLAFRRDIVLAVDGQTVVIQAPQTNQ